MKKKVLVILLCVIAFVLISCFGFCFYLYSEYTDNDIEIVQRPDNLVVDKTDNSNSDKFISTETYPIETEHIDIYEQDIIKDEVVNILLIGLDARDYSDFSRSDTMILASYNKVTGETKLTSFMRDSWVNIPEKGWNRINAATAYGGTGLLINTINENFDLDIQNFIQVKFEDFVYIIDTLGGVSLGLSQKEIDFINDGVGKKDYLNEKPGVVHLNGIQALTHCRNRKVGNYDYERTERQRNTIKALIDQTKERFTVSQVVTLAYKLKDSINTNMELDTLIELAQSAMSLDSLNVDTARIPFDGTFKDANKFGAAVLELDIVENTKRLHKFIFDLE